MSFSMRGAKSVSVLPKSIIFKPSETARIYFKIYRQHKTRYAKKQRNEGVSKKV